MSKSLSLDDIYPRIQLDDIDNRDFQSRRFGMSFLWVGLLASGRVVVGNPMRDPVAVINSFEELVDILKVGREYSFRRIAVEEREVTKRMERARVQESEPPLDLDLDIDL
jgi:hypothetical protein